MVLLGMASLPLTSAARDTKMPKVGVLAVGVPDPNEFLSAFRDGLRQSGYVEGHNIQFDIQSAEGHSDRLPQLAAELVRRKVDVIVGFQTPAVQAAKDATTKIPIVMDAGDPVGMGLVKSFARPGGNITGVSAATAELAPKKLELLRQVVPSFKRVALLLNPTDPFSNPFLKINKLGAGQLGVELEVIPVNGIEELASAFDIAVSVRADAAVVQPSLPIARAANSALAHRLPTISLNPAFPKAGGLMSYAADYAEVWRVLAQFYVVKILKGTKPADLLVSQPSKLDLIINLKTSKELGLTIPPSVLALVNEIIDDK